MNTELADEHGTGPMTEELADDRGTGPMTQQDGRPHPGLKFSVTDGVATITLANPDRRNAQSPTLWAALAGIGRDLDPTVEVVVINAEGPDFSAGLDRAMLSANGMPGEPHVLALAGRDQAQVPKLIEGFQEAFTIWSTLPQIVIAAVQGHAIGAGFQLALACDLRIVTEDVKFAMRETSLGLVPDLGGTAPLARTVGYSRALEICLTGRFVGAGEAVGSGLASLAVPADQLAEATGQVVAAVKEAPSRAAAELKQLLLSAGTAEKAEQLGAEREAQARLMNALARGE